MSDESAPFCLPSSNLIVDNLHLFVLTTTTITARQIPYSFGNLLYLGYLSLGEL